MTLPFSKILIANRGEIACRVIRGARARGLRTVAVHSEADRNALHVRLADEAVLIGPAAVTQSYLKIANIIEAARRTGAQAIHPGYGFLSENAAFAEACAEAGIVFIGPSPEVIRIMGDKALAKRRMIDADVPCVPGYQGDAQDDGTFVAEARRIGFPVMVKAAAGGGGRGMRLVHAEAELGAALKSARSEAKGAFGNDTLLLERAVMEPRHVEIQVFGDTLGNVIHLGERDCSIQRRHQKVVEEAPSPAVDAQLRKRMGMAAVKAAQSIGYVGAGTVEFLLDVSGEFYFLEMNTRLQVEHPVTELVTGLDLVTMQLDVAMGLPLPVAQDQVRQNGHAIEVRLYAEDPVKNFLPQTGDVLQWRPAEGEGIRVDHGLKAIDRVSPFYDPMVAKVIAWGRDRDEARQRLIRAVEDTTLFGIASNKAFLSEILKQPEFAAGQATTAFISRHFGEGWLGSAASGPALLAAAFLFGSPSKSRAGLSPLWRGSVLHLSRDDDHHEADIAFDGSDAHVKVDGTAAKIEPIDDDGQTIRLRIDGHTRPFRYLFDGDVLHLDDDGAVYRFEDVTYAPAKTSSAGSDGVVRAPMNGLLRAIDVSEGMAVTAGQSVAILEAMKMEHRILAPIDGIISSVSVGAGTQVAARDVLLRIGETSA